MVKSKKMAGIIIVLLILLVGLGFKKLFYNSGVPEKVSEFVYGPFTIRMESFTTSEFNMNYGKYYKRTHIAYSVWYGGKLVAFPAELQTNTGFSHLWRVYIVKDAPQPTLFAGSQSLFMITAKDDSFEVLPVNVQSTDFIKFQWLDAVDGHPGPAFELFMGDERTSMEHPDTLQGGRYLMINQKMVIHIPTMEKIIFYNGDSYIENYDKDGEALAFSPDEKVIVFPGHFLTWNSNETPENYNALIYYDFRNDVKKVLPYNKTETRLYRAQDLTIDWFNTYFKWDITDTATIIRFRKPEKPIMWQGYFKDDYFHLYPVDDKMLEIFKQFIFDYLKWTPENILSDKYHEYTGRVYQLGHEKLIFNLVGKENEILFSKDLYEEKSESAIKLVNEIGNAFNEVLKTGKYQEYFTFIPDQDIYR